MQVLATLEVGQTAGPDISSRGRRDDLVARLRLHELGRASMTQAELEVAESLKPQPELPIRISEARRHEIICEALMLGSPALRSQVQV